MQDLELANYNFNGYKTKDFICIMKMKLLSLP